MGGNPNPHPDPHPNPSRSGGRRGHLLDAVAVVNVDVNVEHALVVLEQLEDGEHLVMARARGRGRG